MLRDALLRVRISGYGMLSLALGVKYSELVALQNMTVFAPDDASIFSEGHECIHNARLYSVYLVVDGVIITTKHNDDEHHV